MILRDVSLAVVMNARCLSELISCKTAIPGPFSSRFSIAFPLSPYAPARYRMIHANWCGVQSAVQYSATCSIPSP